MHYLYHNIALFIVTYLITVRFKKKWCKFPQDGEIIAPKHEGALLKIVRVNDRIAHLFM